MLRWLLIEVAWSAVRWDDTGATPTTASPGDVALALPLWLSLGSCWSSSGTYSLTRPPISISAPKPTSPNSSSGPIALAVTISLRPILVSLSTITCDGSTCRISLNSLTTVHRNGVYPSHLLNSTKHRCRPARFVQGRSGRSVRGLQPQGLHVRLKDLIMELYDCPDYSDKDTQTGLTIVKEAALSILGVTTPAGLATAVTDADWQNGLLPRFLLLTPEAEYAERPALKAYQPVPPDS